MSTFNTYPREKRIFEFLLKNTWKLNILLLIAYLLFIPFNVGLEYPIANVILLLGITIVIIYEVYLRKIKTNGVLEITKTKLCWTSENNDLKIDREEIEKIIIVKAIMTSFISGDYKAVLFDIIRKDKSVIRFAVNKSSTDMHEFDVLDSLKVFSSINKIPLEKTKGWFFNY